MFTESAAIYDAIYSFRDYAGQAAKLTALIDERLPNAATLLDVACGHGRHMRAMAIIIIRMAVIINKIIASSK